MHEDQHRDRASQQLTIGQQVAVSCGDGGTRLSGFEDGISLLEGSVHEDQRMKINPTLTS
jgi:hypothetical protein